MECFKKVAGSNILHGPYKAVPSPIAITVGDFHYG